MALQQINTLQNKDYNTYLTEFSNKYMYESLANLGQRYSLQSEGISTNSFNILNLLNLQTNEYFASDENRKNVLAKMYVNKNKLMLELYNTESDSNLINCLYSEELQYTLNNAIYTDTNIILNNKINSIDYYKENMLIFTKNDVLTVCYIGCDNDLGMVELNLEEYDVVTNTLISSVKLINMAEEYHYLYYLYKNSDSYELLKYKISDTECKNLYGDFETLVTYIYTNIIKDTYNLNFELEPSDIIASIIQIGFESDLATDQYTKKIIPIKVGYNENEVDGFYIKNGDDEHDNTALYNIYNQLNVFYMYIYNYYCNIIYKIDNNQLNKLILYAIFLKVFEHSGIEDINQFICFIPVDYVISYFCRSNDTYYIYSNDIPVNIFFSNLFISNVDVVKYVRNDESLKQIILATSQSIEKVSLYNFNVDYNKDNNTIINNIDVKEMYSTPHIVNGYWVVNGVESLYKAIGNDAGNPNIIILYTDDLTDLENKNENKNITKDVHYKLLTSINSEYFDSVYWDVETIPVSLYPEKVTSTTTDTTDVLRKNRNYTCKFLVPKEFNSDANLVESRTANFNEIFKYSLIINISNIKNLRLEHGETIDSDEFNKITGDLGLDTLVSSLWIYDNGEFKQILNPGNNDALSFADMCNVNNLIQYNLKCLANGDDGGVNVPSQLEIATLADDTKNDIDVNKLITTILKNQTAYTLYMALPKNLEDEKYTEANNYNNDLTLKLTTDYPVVLNNFEYYLNNDALNNLVTEATIYPVTGSMTSYIPASSVPVFNLSEYFTMDINNLNTVKLFTFASEIQDENIKNNKLYYAYIKAHTDNKNVLCFGTDDSVTSSTTKLMQSKNNKDFSLYKKHDTLQIEFDNTYINANNIVLGKSEIKKSDDATEKHAPVEINKNDTVVYNSLNIRQNDTFNTNVELQLASSSSYATIIGFNNIAGFHPYFAKEINYNGEGVNTDKYYNVNIKSAIDGNLSQDNQYIVSKNLSWGFDCDIFSKILCKSYVAGADPGSPNAVLHNISEILNDTSEENRNIREQLLNHMYIVSSDSASISQYDSGSVTDLKNRYEFVEHISSKYGRDAIITPDNTVTPTNIKNLHNVSILNAEDNSLLQKNITTLTTCLDNWSGKNNHYNNNKPNAGQAFFTPEGNHVLGYVIDCGLSKDYVVNEHKSDNRLDIGGILFGSDDKIAYTYTYTSTYIPVSFMSDVDTDNLMNVIMRSGTAPTTTFNLIDNNIELKRTLEYTYNGTTYKYINPRIYLYNTLKYEYTVVTDNEILNQLNSTGTQTSNARQTDYILYNTTNLLKELGFAEGSNITVSTNMDIIKIDNVQYYMTAYSKLPFGDNGEYKYLDFTIKERNGSYFITSNNHKTLYPFNVMGK